MLSLLKASELDKCNKIIMDSIEFDSDSELYGPVCAWKWVVINHCLQAKSTNVHEYKLVLRNLKYKLNVRHG